MSQNKTTKVKTENLKTEFSYSGKQVQMQLGKLVKLPYIRNINYNGHAPSLSRKSLECGEAYVMRNSNKKSHLLDQTHCHMLSLQELELCNERTTNNKEVTLKETTHNKECLPRIVIANNAFLLREKSFDSLEQMWKIRSEKNIIKVDAGDHLKDYKIGSIIGRGSYAIVRLCKNKENKKFAVKTYLNSILANQDKKHNLQREIQILKKITHPNLLKYYETIYSEESVNIVTELLENTSLIDYLKNQGVKHLEEETCRVVMRQVMRAVAYLHGKDIVHRDVKLENVLITNECKIKIIDFGFSICVKDGQLLHDFCGTPHYIAPEVIQREGYYGKPADIWSLGVLLYRIAIGCFPYKGLNQKNLFAKVMKGELKIPAYISEQLEWLLNKMLSFDCKRRPSAEEVLYSEWFST